MGTYQSAGQRPIWLDLTYPTMASHFKKCTEIDASLLRAPSTTRSTQAHVRLMLADMVAIPVP